MNRIYGIVLIWLLVGFSVFASAETRDPSQSLLPAGVSDSSASEQSAQETPARDPFATQLRAAPVNLAAPRVNSTGARVLNLEGIAIGSSGKAFVVLNGKKYFKGEYRNGIEVLEIQKKEVRIRFDGEEKTLSMTTQFQKSAAETETPLSQPLAGLPGPPTGMEASSNSSSNLSSSLSNSEPAMSSSGGSL